MRFYFVLCICARGCSTTVVVSWLALLKFVIFLKRSLCTFWYCFLIWCLNLSFFLLWNVCIVSQLALVICPFEAFTVKHLFESTYQCFLQGLTVFDCGWALDLRQWPIPLLQNWAIGSIEAVGWWISILLSRCSPKFGWYGLISCCIFFCASGLAQPSVGPLVAHFKIWWPIWVCLILWSTVWRRLVGLNG